MMDRRNLDGHLNADLRFYCFNGHHFDGVPRTTVQKSTVWPFADAFLTADAEQGIDLDVAERGVVFVLHPIHAVTHRAVRHAGGRTGATRTAFCNYRKLFGPLLARGKDPLRLRLHLHDGRGHAESISLMEP